MANYSSTTVGLGWVDNDVRVAISHGDGSQHYLSTVAARFIALQILMTVDQIETVELQRAEMERRMKNA